MRLWLTAAGGAGAALSYASKETPLFQSALKKQRRLTGKPINGDDIYRTMKRRLKDFGMPLLYSPHSFRVTTITDSRGQPDLPRTGTDEYSG
jgi:hypothetical protein